MSTVQWLTVYAASTFLVVAVDMVRRWNALQRHERDLRAFHGRCVLYRQRLKVRELSQSYTDSTVSSDDLTVGYSEKYRLSVSIRRP